ncbi:hypothetical protein KGQ20_38255, partial [Catenulispora sp. NF23]|uniref:hypothetical protein n=1 Tax=Catenulispora pinistramenti TaxID=2705254 RepID=UPI001BAC1CA2
MVSRPFDWSPLGLVFDPTPGDLDGVRRAASFLTSVASATSVIEQALTEILGTAAAGNFAGATAQALQGKISGDFARFMNAANNAFTTANQAATAYAGVMETQQGIADTALNKAIASGLPKTDPQVVAWAREATQAGWALAAAGNTATAAIQGVSSGVEPISAMDQFWQWLGWIALFLMLPAIAFGGVFALIAFAVNMTLFIHAAVQYANGQIPLTQLLLAFLGILAPTTRGLDLAELIPALGRGIDDVARSVVGFVRVSFTDFMALARGVQVSSLFSVSTLLSLGRFVFNGVLWVFDGVRAMPALIRDGAVTLGQGFRDLAVGTGAGLLQEFRTGSFVRLFVPLAGDEIRGAGLIGAFRLGVLERG